MATNDDDDDVDAFDERGLLRDGKRTRVSLMMRDGCFGAATPGRQRRFDDESRVRFTAAIGPPPQGATLYAETRGRGECCAKRPPTDDGAASARRRRTRPVTSDALGRDAVLRPPGRCRRQTPQAGKLRCHGARKLRRLEESIAAARCHRRGTTAAPRCCARYRASSDAAEGRSRQAGGLR